MGKNATNGIVTMKGKEAKTVELVLPFDCFWDLSKY